MAVGRRRRRRRRRRSRRRRARQRHVGEDDDTLALAALDTPHLTPVAPVLRLLRHGDGEQEEVEEIRWPKAEEDGRRNPNPKKRQCGTCGSSGPRCLARN